MKPTSFLGLLLAGAVSFGASAVDNENIVRIVARDAKGTAVGVVPISLDSKIRFSSDKIEFFDKETRTASYPYSKVETLTFVLPGDSGVASVEADNSALTLLSNPVETVLSFSGFDGELSPLAIYGLDGTLRLSVPEWNGEDIDVSSFTPGLYFVKVNRITLKFIKQ